MKDSTTNIGVSPVVAGPPVATPDRLLCSQCKHEKSSKDCWWCRTCQKMLCSHCNLLQGHTEHRTTPWRPDELVRSLIDTIDARCSARLNRAAEEEAAIKEYMREIENYFLAKLQRQLDERNGDDRSLGAAVCFATGTSLTERKRWPPACHAPIPASPAAKDPSTTFTGFAMLTDDSVARLLNEISRLLPADGARSVTVTKFPRTVISAENSASSSPVIGNRNRAGTKTPTEIGSPCDDDFSRSPSSAAASRFYNFAAILPKVEPLEFAHLLEQQRDCAPRSRSFSNYAGMQPRSNTPFVEHVNSRAHSPAPTANGAAPLTVYGSVDVDAVDKSIERHSSTDVVIPLTPTITYTRPLVRNSYLRSSLPTATPKSNDVASPTSELQTAKSNVQLMISEDTQTSSSSWLTSATQTEPPSFLAERATASLSPTGATSNGDGPGPSNDHDVTDGPAPLVDTSLESTGAKSKDSNSPIRITAFHFGDDYLTRPIDVRPLPGGRLAVSDSCGGVYITDMRGGVIHHIYLENYSASSLCYLAPNHADLDRYPPLLLVSVLKKENRCINFYEARNFTLLDSVLCPSEPDIDLGRSRWLAVDDRGAVFMISGDGKTSALWKYHSNPRAWGLLKQTPKTRYQYLDVIHSLSDSASVTLLTCDGIRGSLLMITISRSSNSQGHHKVLGEQDFSQAYGLGTYIRSPASAVVDHLGNMLILDYSNGKLWLLKAPSGNRQGGDRRLKLLTEVGAQQGIGIAVTAPWSYGKRSGGDQWCYLACFNKKRVHAVKYVSE